VKYISKSSYMAGLDCHRQLWNLLWDRKSMAPHDAMTELLFEFGRRFGTLAHSQYPDAVLIDINIFKLNRAVEDTRKAIEDGAGVILEAAFCYQQCRVLSDVVERQEDGTWHLIEVKSSTGVDAKHYPDLAYQKWVMEQAGYPVSRCSVIHADKAGVWPNVSSVFKQVDVTEEVNAAVQVVGENVAAMLPFAQPGSAAPEARPLFSKICHGCNFKNTVCWKGIIEPTIYDVVNVRKISGLVAQDVLYVKDIPDDYDLYAKDRRNVDCMNAKAVNIDQDSVRSMLDELEYPIYFLDFETAAVAVPLFNGNHPWEKLPFQYSLHVVEESGDIRHLEYLHEDNSDPAEALADRLAADIGDSGSVVVYHKTMESGVLKYLADRFPRHTNAFHSMDNRIWDLEVVFLKHYRDWRFGSRSSIKVVLPALIPALSYEDEAISDGGAASLGWVQMLESDDFIVRQEKADALRSYCKLDTLAMVELLSHVRSAVNKPT
jgi:hypothetical protein